MEKLEKLSLFLGDKINQLLTPINQFETCLNYFLDENFEQSNSWDDEEDVYDVTFYLYFEGDEHYEIEASITTNSIRESCATDRGTQEWTEVHAQIEEIVCVRDLILEEEVEDLNNELNQKLINKLEI